MAAWDLKVGNDVVGRAIEFRRKDTARKVINTALDGSVYIQNTGQPIIRYEVRCYCKTAENRDKLDNASNNGDLITVVINDNDSVIGYVEDDTINWQQEWPDRHGVGHFKLIVR